MNKEKWVLLKDIDYFGKLISKGVIYKQVAADYYDPIFDGVRHPNFRITFMIVKANPDYFLQIQD